MGQARHGVFHPAHPRMRAFLRFSRVRTLRVPRTRAFLRCLGTGGVTASRSRSRCRSVDGHEVLCREHVASFSAAHGVVAVVVGPVPHLHYVILADRGGSVSTTRSLVTLKAVTFRRSWFTATVKAVVGGCEFWSRASS